MPDSDLCLDHGVPGGLGGGALEEREWGGQTVLDAEELNMVRPGRGVQAAHLQYVLHHAVYCGCGVAPDVLK